MYKLEFTLKQHTPIIHFQHDQDGATLRASEVKPKLDRFIIEKSGGNDLARRNFPHWFINEKHNALNYKIRITASEKENSLNELINLTIGKNDYGEKKPVYKNLPGFFGNMMKVEEFENNEKPLKKVSFYNKICFNVITQNLDLKSTIDNYIADFFLENNFGTRQTKGFGSFTIINKNPGSTGLAYFTLDYGRNQFERIFSDIDLFYRTLKSGLNIKTKNKDGKLVDKLYFKSLMFKYAKKLSPSEQWDKRTIRHALYIDDWKYKNDTSKAGILNLRTEKNGTVQYAPSKSREGNYYDFRDLLGLSSEQDWLFYKNKKVTKKVTDNKNVEIERFHSPILFKPIYDGTKEMWFIFIILNPIPDSYLGAEVEVKNKSNSVNLTIFPSFKISEYLKFAIKEYDVEDFEFGEGFSFENTDEAYVIDNIYDQLKNQQKYE